jgi:hypothetical protein
MSKLVVKALNIFAEGTENREEEKIPEINIPALFKFSELKKINPKVTKKKVRIIRPKVFHVGNPHL